MNSFDITKEKTSVSVTPLRMAQWTVDKMIAKTSVRLQAMLYSQNLSPEEFEHLCLIRMIEQSAYSRVRNITELYGDADEVSAPRFASYNVNHYLNSVTSHILKLTESDNIEMIVSCDSSCKNAVFDLRRVGIVLYNLISNSIIHNKYKHKIISMRGFLRSNDFVISVTDNGRGIAPNIRRTMFSAYENKPDPRSASIIDSGLVLGGIGLSVCRKVAKDMDGDVFYVPTKGSGTTFELVVPQTNRSNLFGDTILANIDTEELEAFLAGALLHLKGY
ncbi:MAG: ATP-binding protein [Clostridia bacterium]|nr:ATP-binding protein [Clostridia bacterium]